MNIDWSSYVRQSVEAAKFINQCHRDLEANGWKFNHKTAT